MAPKGKLTFWPQKKQKTCVSSAEKLEVFVVRYCEKAQLVSEIFDEDAVCFRVAIMHRGKPSLLFKLKEHMVDFLQSAHVTGLPSSLEELATCLFTKLQAGSSGGTSEQEHVSHARASQSLLDMACAGGVGGWS